MFFCTFVIFVVAKINFLCIPVDLQFIYLPLQETKIGCFILIVIVLNLALLFIGFNCSSSSHPLEEDIFTTGPQL